MRLLDGGNGHTGVNDLDLGLSGTAHQIALFGGCPVPSLPKSPVRNQGEVIIRIEEVTTTDPTYRGLKDFYFIFECYIRLYQGGYLFGKISCKFTIKFLVFSTVNNYTQYLQ